MNNKIKSVNKISVILFFLLIFLISTLIVLKISNTSNDAMEKNEENTSIRVASSYINMMIRQNDNGKISLLELDGEYEDYKGLLIEDYIGVKGLKAAIFYKNNTIYEAIYEDEFDPELSEKIIEIDGLSFSKDGDLIEINISSSNKTIKRFINLRAEASL